MSAAAAAATAVAGRLAPLRPSLSSPRPSLLPASALHHDAHASHRQMRRMYCRDMHTSTAAHSSAPFSVALDAAAATATATAARSVRDAPAASPLAADRAWLAQQLGEWATTPNNEPPANGNDRDGWGATSGADGPSSRRRPRPQRELRPPPPQSHSAPPSAAAAAAAPLPSAAVPVPVPEAVQHGPLPESFSELMRILAPFDEARSRFALLERCLDHWSRQCPSDAPAAQHPDAPPRWVDCVRTLAQMRLAALDDQLGHASSSACDTSALPAAALTQRHFAMVFESLLSACMLPHRRRHVRFPPGMRAATFDGPLLSYVIGAEGDAEPGSVRRPLSPDFRFYSRLLARIEASVQVRDPSFNMPMAAERLRIDPQGETAWMLMLALEDTKGTATNVDRALQMEQTDATASAADVDSMDALADESPVDDVKGSWAEGAIDVAPLPPLSLVRHLWSALLASEVSPSLQCLNLVLSISEERARTEAARRGTSFELQQVVEAKFDLDVLDPTSSATASADAEQTPSDDAATVTEGEPAAVAGDEAVGTDNDRPLTPRHLRATDEHLEFIWSVWVDAERVHDIYPDMLSRVLVLRLCYRHRHYGYMGRLLTQHAREARLVSMAQPVLGGHRFTQPHLLLSALTHSSKVKTRIDSNERMEFLGDSVLDVLIREATVTRAAALLGVPLRPEDVRPLPGGRGSPSPVQVDMTDPYLFHYADGAPAHMVGSLKGKFVSHRYLAPLSRRLGLSHMLLEANRDVKNSLSGWVLQREEKSKAALRRQHQHMSAKHHGQLGMADDDGANEMDAMSLTSDAQADLARSAVSAVSDHLAEDVFEACLAALFLDPTATSQATGASAQQEAAETDADAIRTPDFPASPSGGSANTPAPSTASTQAHGMPAVRAFIHSTMGGDMEQDISGAVRRYSREDSAGQQYRRHGFDLHVNYKAQLEEWVRQRYTDEHGVCHAHVLYWLVDTLGAHTYRVKVAIKLLPDACVPRNRITEHGGRASSMGHQYQPRPDAPWNMQQQPQTSTNTESDTRDSSSSLSSSSVSSSHPSAAAASLVRQLPYLRFLADLERMGDELNAAAATQGVNAGDSSPGGRDGVPAQHYRYQTASLRSVSVLRADSPISFSVTSSTAPNLHPSYDRQFRAAQIQPVLQAAEQWAAFYALQELTGGVFKGRTAGPAAIKREKLQQRKAKRTNQWQDRQTRNDGMAAPVAAGPGADVDPASPLPFPFTSASSYASLLDRLQELTGHRFRNPLLVRALLFHSNLHTYLSYLGAGLVRFYISHVAYTRFPHFEEGFLTRLKDFQTTKLVTDAHLLDASTAAQLDGIMRAVTDAKEEWRRREDGGSEAATTTGPAHGHSSAQAMDPHPLAFQSDLLEALFGVLYLDGGWGAADAFASRTVGPRLNQLHRMLAHEFPDADLGVHSYKERLQSLVQRHFAVTPQYEVCKRDGDRRWAMRVVITHSAMERAAAAGSDPVLHPIVFKTFWGTKLLAEQRAARHAFLVLTQMLQQKKNNSSSGDQAASGGAAAPSGVEPQLPRISEGHAHDETLSADEAGAAHVAAASAASASDSPNWRPEQLRSVLYACEAQARSLGSDDPERVAALRTQLQQLVQRLLSPACQGVAYPAPSPAMPPAVAATNVDAGAVKERGGTSASPALQTLANAPDDEHVDPFEQALASLQPGSVTTSAGAIGSGSMSGRWLLSDYTLLLELLHAQRLWSCFPPLWPLLLDVQLILSPASAGWLVDAFGGCGSMALIIQCLRRVRGQERFAPDRTLYERVMLRCAQANPVWSWQQLHKMLDELDAHQIRPSTRTFNTALYMCARGLACSGAHKEALHAKHHPKATSGLADGIVLAHLDESTSGTGGGGAVASPSSFVGDGRTNPNQAPVSPFLIVKSADRARMRMRMLHATNASAATSPASTAAGAGVATPVLPDSLTIALIAILDSYAGRVPDAMRAIEELQRRVDATALAAGVDTPAPLPQVLAAREWAAAIAEDEEDEERWLGRWPASPTAARLGATGGNGTATTPPFDITPCRTKFSVKHFDTYCDQAGPFIDAALAALAHSTADADDARF